MNSNSPDFWKEENEDHLQPGEQNIFRKYVDPMDLLHMEDQEEAPEPAVPCELSPEELRKSAAHFRKGRKICGRLLMLLGLCLMVCGSMLYYSNELEDRKAGEASAQMLPEVRLAITEKVNQEEKEDPAPTEHVNPYDQEAVKKANEMTVFVKNGWSYIGYLNIPSLNLELPVLSEISDYNLGMAPCRHLGSTKSDDLVLAAHNYDFHFGRIKELGPGEEVTFIDMDGVLSRYQVIVTDVIQPTDIEKVTDPALDLTLYTCTYGGEQRIMVGCKRITEE